MVLMALDHVREFFPVAVHTPYLPKIDALKCPRPGTDVIVGVTRMRATKNRTPFAGKDIVKLGVWVAE